jgi:hypothetical protein
MFLSLVKGAHVFFYSRDAMNLIANRFGYRYMQFPFLHAFVAKDVFENPALANVGAAWDHLFAHKDKLFHDAGQSLVTHLTGDAWRHIAADYFEIRKNQFGL